MGDSCFRQMKINYAETRSLDVGDAACWEEVAVGGHLWRVTCYPRGYDEEDEGKYLSLFLELRSESATSRIKAIFEAFLEDLYGDPSVNHAQRLAGECPAGGQYWQGWTRFVRRHDLQSYYVGDDGCFRISYAVFVSAPGGVAGDAIAVPPSDMRSQFARLLGSDAGTDVSFSVAGEAFPAHRAVLAARSPVFYAELFGDTSDATSSSITLVDIDPATFKLMHYFIYTDDLPGDGEIGDSPTETMKHLLAAADRYALDRLKLMCAQKIWEKVTADTLASTLIFAETYNCPELKNKCIDFFAVERNLKRVIFTADYTSLLQKFPSLVAELEQRVAVHD